MARATHPYIYRAVDLHGVSRTGEIVCASRSEALDALSRDGLTPIELRAAQPAKAVRKRMWHAPFRSFWRAPGSQATARELLELTQSLAALLTAGLLIDRALQVSASLAPRSNVRALTEKWLEAVRAGKTLAQSIDESGQKVPTYYVSMVNAGEVGGSLAATLTRLAELMRRQVEVRERIQSALIYPGLLAGVVVITLVILLTFVLPRFETLFAESEAPLPWSTRAVLVIGRCVSDYWWVLLGAASVAIIGCTTWLRSAAGRFHFDTWLIESRLTLGLPAATASARLLRTLSTLCANGLALPAALRVARGTVGNQRLLAALGAVANEVQAGEAFSSALARAAVFPTVASQLARVGEETGKLDQMLLSAANVLDEETHLRLERLISLLVPLLTVFMGAIVAALIGSVLVGLLSINDLAF